MLEKGLIQVYTGSHKGFNFAPIGLAFRAAGQGLRVLVTGFAPHELMDELFSAARYLRPNLKIDYLVVKHTGNAVGTGILSAFRRSRTAVFSDKYDIVILNGVHQAISSGFLPIHRILDLMDERPTDLELILTGPEAPQQIVDKADLVTYMVYRSKKTPKRNAAGSPGYVDVVTGNGKGKTTYCLGKAILTSCRDVPASVLQFIKSPQPYGEVMAIARFPRIEILSMGEGFVNANWSAPEKKHLDAARKAWEECLREVFSLKYGMVVLDEINTASYYGLVSPEEIRNLCSLKPRDLRLLLSGRHAHPDVAEAADAVIEMEKIKHPFEKGVKARKGIEY